MWKFIYNLFLPIGFLFFIPGLLYKYRHRGGYKETFSERFGRFSPERRKELEAFRGAIWVHAVSVGETVVALSLIRGWSKAHPERKFVISTTTTTGQELARSKCPENCAVIFAPVDFKYMVRSTFNVVQPSMLAIFETELWPNMIWECRRRNLPLVLVNGRMSDHSSRSYFRAGCFFRPLFNCFDVLLLQTPEDEKRFRHVAPECHTEVTGNLKLDQRLPDDLGDPGFTECFGANKTIILGASTHAGEESLIAESYLALKRDFPDLKLVLVPRHAERAADVGAALDKLQLNWGRRTERRSGDGEIDVLLADTTGEMLKLMSGADIVIMGKSLAGHDEGHNLIEPALLAKPIITGGVLRNFRALLDLLKNGNGVIALEDDSRLVPALKMLLTKPELRKEYGSRAEKLIAANRGAASATVNILEQLLKEN